MKLAVLFMSTAAILAAQDSSAIAYQSESVIHSLDASRVEAFIADLKLQREHDLRSADIGSEKKNRSQFASSAQPVPAITDPVLRNLTVQSAGDVFRYTLASQVPGPPQILIGPATSGYLLSGDYLCYIIWEVQGNQVRFWTASTQHGGVQEIIVGRPTVGPYCTVNRAVGALQTLGPSGVTLDLTFSWQYDNPSVNSQQVYAYTFNPTFKLGYSLHELKKPLTLVAP